MAKSVQLKNVKDQVIVITGASSGIGLATARMAAEKGARLVLSSRNEEDLKQICREVELGGGRAISVVADVAHPDEVKNITVAALKEFGTIDTWINNAGVSSFGKLTEMHLDEKHRIFDTNFWGVVHGCRAVLPHLKARGGAIINVGSVLSNRSIPIQGIYSASKHAVKAYTDALRMEIEEEGAPVSVTLIKPAAIDTPYVEHARNHQPSRTTHMPPVYAPEVVARAILRCAERPTRDVFIGGGAKIFSLMETYLPRLTDKVMEKTMIKGQYKNEPKLDHSKEGLFKAPKREGQVHGGYEGRVRQTSFYTFFALRPGLFLGLLGAGLLVGLSRRALRQLVAPPSEEAMNDTVRDLREAA